MKKITKILSVLMAAVMLMTALCVPASAADEFEKAKILKQLEGKKYSLQRSKGLGENEPEMMSLTTMHPDTRRLVRVNPTDVEETAHIFDVLLGDDLDGRKRIIAEHGAEYLDMLDLA